jgi:hypothetical protein
MKLTEQEKRMRGGAQGPVVAEALDYIIQLGEAFGAERLVDISYCHYPAEMGIYEGAVEDLLAYAFPQSWPNFRPRWNRHTAPWGYWKRTPARPSSSGLCRLWEAISHRWKAALSFTSIPYWARGRTGADCSAVIPR